MLKDSYFLFFKLHMYILKLKDTPNLQVILWNLRHGSSLHSFKIVIGTSFRISKSFQNTALTSFCYSKPSISTVLLLFSRFLPHNLNWFWILSFGHSSTQWGTWPIQAWTSSFSYYKMLMDNPKRRRVSTKLIIQTYYNICSGRANLVI